MGVQTTADKRLDSARSHIKEATADLSEILVGEVDGHDKFNGEYKAKIRESFQILLELKELLK